MHIQVCVLRHLELHVELGVSTGWSVELDSGIAAADFEVHVRLFQLSFPPRLNCVMKADVVGIAARDAHIAHTQAHVKHATGLEIASLIVTLFVIPVIGSRTKRHQEKKTKNYLMNRSQANERPFGHKTPPERAGTC
jgi:hypothetical protein